jgi:hypothetical protein
MNKYEKNNFSSTIEKGRMNVQMFKDIDTDLAFADNKTKRKLQFIFLRKELASKAESMLKTRIESKDSNMQTQYMSGNSRI